MPLQRLFDLIFWLIVVVNEGLIGIVLQLKLTVVCWAVVWNVTTER